MDETAISSADRHDVTAMKSTISSATAPPLPSSAVAAVEAASPDVTCS